MRLSKRVAAIFLVAVMLLSAIPFAANATDIANATQFESAIAAANAGDTITLTGDVDLTQYPAYGAAGSMHYIDISNLTIDLNGYTITIGGRWSTLFTGTNGKIMNGTCVGTPSPANYQYGIYVWGAGSGTVNDANPQPASITLENLTCNYGIHCWNSNVTIINCDVTGSAAYYAVWSDENSHLTINGGTYTTGGSAVLGAAISTDTDINGDPYTGDIAVLSGTFTVPAGKKLVSTGGDSKPDKVQVYGGTFKNADDSAYTVLAENLAAGAEQDANGSIPAIVAKVGSTYYASFEAAVAAARTGSVKTVTCLSDIDLTQYPAYGAAGSMHYIDISGVTVDLNDKTMTIGGRWSTLFTGTNGKIMNGTCVGTPSPANYQYGIYVWGAGSGTVNDANPQPASITLENLTCNYGIHCWNSNVDIVNCDVTGSAAYYAVWSDENSHLTINGGTYTTGGSAVLGAAISTDTDINGDPYTGDISVLDGTFTVPAGKKLVSTGGDSKPDKVKVYGGTFKNADGSAYTVLAENLGENAVETASGTVFVANVKLTHSETDTYFTTLEAAVAAAAEGDTITLLDDIDLSALYGNKAQHRIDITGLTIDLGGHTFTTSSRWCVLFEGTNGTIKNGTMQALNNSDADNYQYGIYVWGRDDAEGYPDPEQKPSITLEDLTINYGIHLYNAEVTVIDCDVTGSASYYAIWSDCASKATIESGNFTTGGAAVLGAAKYQDATHSYTGNIKVKDGNFTVPAGKKLVQTGGSCQPDKVKFYGGTVKYANDSVYTVLADNLGENCVQNMETGTVLQTAANNGTNITVAETISENFYIDADYYEENYGDNAYVSVYSNQNSNVSETPEFETVVQKLSALPSFSDADSEYDGARMLSVLQAPAQSTEPITVKVFANKEDADNDENALNSYTYSVFNYCQEILDGEQYSAPLKELAETTLDYAAAAQLVFNYNTGDLATKAHGNEFYNEVEETNLSGLEGITTKPACIKTATFVVKSDLEINLLSLTPIYVTSASIDTTKGASRFTVSDKVNGDYYEVNIKGIEPANMNKTITIVTSEGNIELTANAMMKILSNNADANLANLAKAMYRYGAAAYSFFGA